jgi:molecular chaperone HtpG
MIVKLGLLQDEKFYERIKEVLIWKNSQGTWAPIGEEKKIFYSTIENSPLLKLYKEPVLFATAPIDTAVIQHLENKLDITFQRIDGALDETLLDKEREKTLLDTEGKTESGRIADFIKGALKEVDVEAKSFASDHLPGLVVLDENQRRLRDYMSLTQGKKGFEAKKTFVVNTNNKLIQTIFRLHKKEPEMASSIAKSIYDLSLLAQREIEPAHLEEIVAHQNELLEKMAALIV